MGLFCNSYNWSYFISCFIICGTSFNHGQKFWYFFLFIRYFYSRWGFALPRRLSCFIWAFILVFRASWSLYSFIACSWNCLWGYCNPCPKAYIWLQSDDYFYFSNCFFIHNCLGSSYVYHWNESVFGLSIYFYNTFDSNPISC